MRRAAERPRALRAQPCQRRGVHLRPHRLRHLGRRRLAKRDRRMGGPFARERCRGRAGGRRRTAEPGRHAAARHGQAGGSRRHDGGHRVVRQRVRAARRSPARRRTPPRAPRRRRRLRASRRPRLPAHLGRPSLRSRRRGRGSRPRALLVRRRPPERDPAFVRLDLLPSGRCAPRRLPRRRRRRKPGHPAGRHSRLRHLRRRHAPPPLARRAPLPRLERTASHRAAADPLLRRSPRPCGRGPLGRSRRRDRRRMVRRARVRAPTRTSRG